MMLIRTPFQWQVVAAEVIVMPRSCSGRMSCVVRGASDTTFYILAVYFGSVGITKTRNAVTCGLIADFSGIIAAILISYLFFF